VISVWGFLLDGVFIGATRTRELMMAMVVSLAVFVAASAALLALHGNHGLWIALLIFMATRGVTLARYLPGMSREIAAA
jgi:MATE family multidrug resistance protein